MTEQTLITAAQHGNQAATDQLLRNHRWLAHHIAATYYWAGADPDDIEQEALIAINDAIHAYQPGQGSTFRSFAALCIRRRLAMQLQYARRLRRHGNLVHAVRDDENGGWVDPLERVADPRADVAATVELRDRARRILACCAGMSGLERRSILGVAVGLSYGEIGGGLRAVDNAVQRARAKLREAA